MINTILYLLDLTVNDNRLSAYHISIYNALLNIWSKKDFTNQFFIEKYDVMRRAHITRNPTYSKIMSDLHQLGYIDYNPSIKSVSIIKEVKINRVTFNQSSIYSFENFKKSFEKKWQEKIDLFYYYNKVKVWADEKEAVSDNWIKVARKFIVEDRLNGKLKLIAYAS